MWKRNKAKQSYEKIILKGNRTTTYIEHKNRNTGTSVLIHPQNAEKQYISLKASFGLFIGI